MPTLITSLVLALCVLGFGLLFLRKRAPRCPVCRVGYVNAESIERCVTCETAHHPHCFREIGRCGRPGCQETKSRPDTWFRK